MNLSREIEKIFTGPQEVTDIEVETLIDCLQWMRDDAENGMPAEVIHAWSLKIQGIVEFLDVCGKLDGKQTERIREILKVIAGENYE